MAETRLNGEILARLKEPFPSKYVGWKAQSTFQKDGQTWAVAVAYIDARLVMARLDEVVGPENWEDTYEVIRDTGEEIEVKCRLTVLGIAKEDVGSGRDAKAAFSDAFKRVAVKFGIGRYLYFLPKAYVPYDEKRRRLKEVPQLPDWALPVAERRNGKK